MAATQPPDSVRGQTYGAEPETIEPDTLPETPTGWTRHLVMHLNFGRGKGAATYAIHDDQGRRIKGIAHAYDTMKGGGRGFQLLSDPEPRWLTWSELRDAYARARQAAP